MTLVIRHAIRCDLCFSRYEPSFEMVANAAGKTKGCGAAQTQAESKSRGWVRKIITTKKRGYRTTIDLCPDCKRRKVDDKTFWFED